MAKKYTYYRIYITDFMRNGDAQNFACISEIYLYDAGGNDISRNEGCEYSASSIYSSDGAVANAFDGYLSSLWHSAINGFTQWICIKFPSEVAISSFGIMPRSDGWKDYINSFTFEASNDGQNWDVLLDQSDIYSGWTSGTERVFIIPNNYNSIDDIVAGIDNATQLVTSTKYDDNTYTMTGVDWFIYGGTVCSNIYASGNSWIGLGSSSEHLKVNRRDAAMWNLWREEGTYRTTTNTYKFLRIRWSGYSAYSSTADSALITYDILLFDTGDIMLYLVDIPTSNYSGTFTLGNLSYTAPTEYSRYATFYVQEDGSYIADYNKIILASKRYLVRDGSTIYTVADNALVEITGELNSELFISSGVDDIPNGALLMTLSAPEVLCWTDAYTVPVLEATVTAIPQSQSVISSMIDLTHATITGIESATADCDGDLIVAVSFDDKQTWKAWNGEQWVTLSDDYSGMSKDMLESITYTQWNELYAGATGFYIRVALLDATQSVTEIVIDFSN